MHAVSRGRILIFALCTALALAIAGCGSSDSSTGSSGETTSASSSDVSTNLKAKPKVTVPDGEPPKELEEIEVVEGDGTEAKSGDEVTVQYVGVDYKNGKEFDSSWSRSEPFTFTLGAGQVIPGWEKGVEGMKAGGRRELIIPPELAYGETGSPPTIGPNETLVFVIDLLEIG
jgi:peptidylprolyl isomerase